MNKVGSVLLWAAVAIVGAISLAALALGRGESVNAVWLVTAALSVYFIAYRFYGKFIAEKVLRLDDSRPTPAVRHNDGLDYVPTNKVVLYGHHFAAIAGAGPLVGPVLAAQMGYLPGTLWILVGVVLAGAVQDFIVLFASMRRDGKSLGEMIKMELGPIPGTLALVGVLAIMIIILAVLALVVVKALTASPWGLFTIAATIPIALLMGVYMRVIRPGRVGEASVFGVVLLLASIFVGRLVAESPTLGTAVHAHRPAARVGAHRLRRGRGQPAGVADARAARLPEHLPEDRHHGRAGGRHLRRRADAGDAGDHALPRRQRAGVLRPAVPVPVHHHRLRRGVGLPLADLVGHDTQDDREGVARALHRLRRHAGRIVRRGDGAHGRVRARPGHLLRDERAGGGDRHHGGARRAGDLGLGLHDHARADRADGQGHRRDHASCRAPAARPRWPWAWRRSSAQRWAARRWRRSGTTSRSCSRRCSS